MNNKFFITEPICRKSYQYSIERFSDYVFRVYRKGLQVAKIINNNHHLITDIWNRNRYAEYLLIDEIAAYRSITLIKEGKV